VYLVYHQKTKKRYAIKKIKKSNYKDEKLHKLFRTEESIMKKITHPNILHCYELLESKTSYYMILDYCKDGDLEQYLQNTDQKYIDEEEAFLYMK
jgi:serine/threonine protein kinase